MLTGLTLLGSLTLAAMVFHRSEDEEQGRRRGDRAGGDGRVSGGVSSYPMKDVEGAWHTFTAEQYKAVAGAMLIHAAALDPIIGGNPIDADELPPAAASLSV